MRNTGRPATSRRSGRDNRGVMNMRQSGYRYAVLALLALVLMQVGKLLWAQWEERPIAVTAVELQDTLQDLRLDVLGDDPRDARARRQPPRVHALFGNRCGLLIAFESTCPGAAAIANDWRDIESLTVGDAVLPVLWLAISPSDTGALSYLTRNGIARGALALRNQRDRGKLGIESWPSAYVVAPGGVVVGRPPFLPNEVRSVPAVCVNASQHIVSGIGGSSSALASER